MKRGWEIKRLGEVCDLQNGFAFKSTDYIEFSNTVNFRMSQIRPGGGVDLENNPKYLPDEYAITYKDYLLKEGDIVIAMTDMATETKILGVPTIVPSDSRNWLLNQRVGKLFNIDKSKVNIAFLKYILVSEPINDYYKKLGRGGLQINIGKQDILNAKIPLPTLPEQQRIVSILDEAFAAITKAKANAEQNLKNAKELFESYLQGVFEKRRNGWEEKKLGDTCVVERGSSPRPIDKYQTDGPDGVNWIKIGDTKGIDKYIYTTKEKITKEGAEKSRYVKDGDFILSNSMSFGKPYIMKTDGYIHDGWFVFRLPNYLDKDFFYYLLTSPNVQKQIQSLGAGAIVKNISGDLVKKVDLFFPKSKTAQQTIVRQLDALRAETLKLEAIYQKKLDDLEELKKSILQKAFAGELKTEKAVAV
jgi:type I restriction enzyme S subunit